MISNFQKLFADVAVRSTWESLTFVGDVRGDARLSKLARRSTECSNVVT